MADLRRQIRRAVHSLSTNLEELENSDPAALIAEAAATHFNVILTAAKRTFPESAIIQLLKPLDVPVPLVTLMTKVATLKGAIDSEP